MEGGAEKERMCQGLGRTSVKERHWDMVGEVHLNSEQLCMLKKTSTAFSMDGRGALKAPPLDEELLAVNVCWGRKNQFCLGIWPPADWP